MIVSKGSADRFINLEPTTGSQETNFGWSKRIVFRKVKNSMIEAASVTLLKPIETEVKSKEIGANDDCLRDRFFDDRLLFFFKPNLGYLSTHQVYAIIKWLLNKNLTALIPPTYTYISSN